MMVWKEEMMLELRQREEKKGNWKREAGYPNLSTPWKTSPNPNLALEFTLCIKVWIFIKISDFLAHFFLNKSIAGFELHEVIASCDRSMPSLTFLVSPQILFQAPPTTFIAQAVPHLPSSPYVVHAQAHQDTPVPPTDHLNGGVKKAASNIM